jgi:hypothetical protein
VQISVAGKKVGIAQLEAIIVKVSAMDLEDEAVIRKTLMKEVKIFNYIPSARENDYLESIMMEYRNRRR